MIIVETNIKTVHYLGSKARMLPVIKEYVDELNSVNGKVCDLFCGSGVVSEFLLQQYDILAVDIQNYSSVYCKARLTGGIPGIDIKQIESEIRNLPIRKKNLDYYKELLRYENKCMKDLVDGHL